VTTEKITAARGYTERGWYVFVLGTGKTPLPNCENCRPEITGPYHDRTNCACLTCHAFYAATRDVDRLTEMIEHHPLGMLAVRTGNVSRLLVVDAEATKSEPNGPTGLEVLDAWESWTNGVTLPATLQQRTGGGGLHALYRLPVSAPIIRSRRVLPSVDVKAEHGYVAVGPGGDGRHWVDEVTPVADAPSELIAWLSTQRNVVLRAHGGEDTTPIDYSFAVARTLDVIPDGWREVFTRDLSFVLRKSGVSRERATEVLRERWTTFAQPPNAQHYVPWEHVEYKIERDWTNLLPDTPSGGMTWAQNIIDEAARRLTASSALVPINSLVNDEEIDEEIAGSGESDEPPALTTPPLAVGELDPDRWYGTHDDGTAARLVAVWGDWFRAIPRQRGGYTWLYYDGVTWHQDTREQIWQAVAEVVRRLPDELHAWEARCAALTVEGVQDWRTAVIGGNGQNAGEFQVVVALRKYGAACRENARKETGARAFARLRAVAEADLDANTRYLGLPDGRALDVRAVHVGSDRSTWLVPARPEMLLTKQLGCAYVPVDQTYPGTCYEFSNFRRYLEGVLPDAKVRSTLQEFVGYALLGEPNEKIVVLLHGPPDSGKTVLLEVLEALFGDYGGWTDAQALVAGKAKSAHQEWLNNIRGLRLVCTPETARGAKIDAAWMKSYSGREPQTTRGAYGDTSVTWKPTGIIFNASNHYVEYDADDTAVAERTQVIEFERQFLRGNDERDDQLPQKIQDGELPIVLNWALDGLRRHGERGGLLIADRIVEWSNRYRIAQDTTGQFIADAREEGFLVEDETGAVSSAFVTVKVVYELYLSWCRVQSVRHPLGRNRFNAHLRTVYGWRDVRSGVTRWHGWTSPVTSAASVVLLQW
jgi:phage/plasmid-associated DNA primase